MTVLDWKRWTVIKPGLDTSWQAGIADGFTHHLQWGPALDFTYGPYGFAGFLEPFYRMTALLAFLYSFAITFGLAALLVAGIRRYWGLAAAGVVSWAVVLGAWALLRPADFAGAVGLGLGLGLVQERRTHLRTTLVVLMGALGATAFMVKLNDGIIVFALLLLAVLGLDVPWRERGRLAGAGVGAYVVVFVAEWAGASQSFSNLASFARASVSLVFGYSANMSGVLGRGFLPLWAIGSVAVLGVMSGVALRRRGRGTQVAVGLMLAGWCWAVAKDGFVNGNHFPAFFRLLLAGVALVALLRPPRVVYAGGLALAACITLTVTTMAPVDPFGGAHAFVAELADMAQAGKFARLTAEARSSLDRREPIPSEVVALVRARTVAIEPWEDLVAWALPQARWDPEPVVQSYSAYTAYTDRLDAAFISSRRAPQRILYRHFRFSFDNRDPYMDPPATTEAVYCHYTQRALVGPWQVLERVGDRCGGLRPIGEVHTRFGRSLDVPQVPGEMVVATFSFGPTLAAKLEALTLKGPTTDVKIWADGQATTYRFVPGTAADVHVMSVPASLGYAPQFTPATVRRMEFSGDGWASGHGQLTVRFFAVSLSGRPAA